MKTLLVAQLGLYAAFIFLPQSLVFLIDGQPELGWLHIAGLCLFGLCALAVKTDWGPVPRGSLLRITTPTKVAVLGSFIFLQLLDAYAVLRYGHQVLYLEAHPSSSAVLLPLKALAFGGFYVALVLLAQAKRVRDEPLAIATLLATLTTGTRGLFFFSLLSLLLLRLGWRRVLRPRYVFAALMVLGAFLVIGFLRDSWEVDAQTYGLVMIQTLNEFVTSSLTITDCSIPGSLVFTQLPAMFLGQLAPSRVTYQLTDCVSPNTLDAGFGIASSTLGELTLLWGPAASLFYVVAPLAYSIGLTAIYRSSSRFLRSVAVATVPFVLYAVRAELLAPAVFAIKATVGLAIAVAIDGAVLRVVSPLPLEPSECDCTLSTSRAEDVGHDTHD